MLRPMLRILTLLGLALGATAADPTALLTRPWAELAATAPAPLAQAITQASQGKAALGEAYAGPDGTLLRLRCAHANGEALLAAGGDATLGEALATLDDEAVAAALAWGLPLLDQAVVGLRVYSDAIDCRLQGLVLALADAAQRDERWRSADPAVAILCLRPWRQPRSADIPTYRNTSVVLPAASSSGMWSRVWVATQRLISSRAGSGGSNTVAWASAPWCRRQVSA